MPKEKAIHTVVPVYMPTESGVSDLELGIATLKSGTLVVEFNNKLPSVAIQRMMQRGELLGLSFVMVDTSEETQEEKDARDIDILRSDEFTASDIPNEEG